MSHPKDRSAASLAATSPPPSLSASAAPPALDNVSGESQRMRRTSTAHEAAPFQIVYAGIIGWY